MELDNLGGACLLVQPVDLSEGSVRALLEAWFRREAARLLPERAWPLARCLGVLPARFVIRDQKTRWGSCSSRGTISLNWRVVLLTPDLADYVLVHELCHLRHLDHSQRFWSMVARLLPDHAERRRRLADMQPDLAW